MSAFGTLGAKNVLILFFSALSVSLLVLLLLFSFFFKNLNFSVKTKDLEEPPILQEEPLESTSSSASEPTGTLNTQQDWDADALSQRLRLNVPKEAKQVKQLLKKPSSDAKRLEDYYIGVESDYPAPVADAPPLASDDDGLLQEAPPPPAPAPEETAASSPLDTTPPAEYTVVPQEANAAAATSTAPQRYRVFVGGFLNRVDAESARSRIAEQGYAPIVKVRGNTYQVQAGVFSSKSKADAIASSIGASVEVY